MPRTRHIPERSCIACGHKGPKGEFVRVVRTPEGSVQPDPSGRSNGRGAYLCHKAGCWEKGLARAALERRLRVKVANDDLDGLKNYLIESAASGKHSIRREV